jgi:hypothetical protein
MTAFSSSSSYSPYWLCVGICRVGWDCVTAYSSLIIISVDLKSPVGGVCHPVVSIECADFSRLRCPCISRERLS